MSDIIHQLSKVFFISLTSGFGIVWFYQLTKNEFLSLVVGVGFLIYIIFEGLEMVKKS